MQDTKQFSYRIPKLLKVSKALKVWKVVQLKLPKMNKLSYAIKDCGVFLMKVGVVLVHDCCDVTS